MGTRNSLVAEQAILYVGHKGRVYHHRRGHHHPHPIAVQTSGPSHSSYLYSEYRADLLGNPVHSLQDCLCIHYDSCHPVLVLVLALDLIRILAHATPRGPHLVHQHTLVVARILMLCSERLHHSNHQLEPRSSQLVRQMVMRLH